MDWPEGEAPSDSGGFLVDMAVHDYDVACWFLRDEPVDVSAVRQGIDSLGLPVRLDIQKVRKGGFAATFVQVEAPEERPPALDSLGFILSGGGLSALVFGSTVIGRDILPRYGAPALVATGVVLLTLYVFHARRRANPILDLRLLDIETFHSGVVGGSIFRIGIGAVPFLMPLMLQVGFGLTPFASGSLTFAAAAGALTMKFTAARILKRFGFKTKTSYRTNAKRDNNRFSTFSKNAGRSFTNAKRTSTNNFWSYGKRAASSKKNTYSRRRAA